MHIASTSCTNMLHEASRIRKLAVFTREGTRLGMVHDVLFDTATRRVSALYITGANKRKVPNGSNIIIPYRWVQDINDVVILKYFPEDLEEKEEEPEDDDEIEFE